MPWPLRMTFLVSAIMLAAHVYLGWRLTFAIIQQKTKRWVRWLPSLLLLSFYMLPVGGYIVFVLSGDVDLFDLPKSIAYWFWFGLVFSFQLTTWVLFSDIIRLGFLWFSDRKPYTINHFYRWALAIFCATIFVFTGIKMYFDTNTIEVQEEILETDSIPEAFDGFKIVHISDIQGDQYTGAENIAHYVEKVNLQNPDLVVFTGDLVTNGTDFLEMAVGEVANTQADYGTYAVIGDHDFWAGLSEVKPVLDKYDIQLLQDENRVVTAGSDSLLLTGITEVYSQSAETQTVDSLTATHPSKPSLKIMASHQVPQLLVDEALNNSYHLILAGHTHGGQVRIPFLGMQFSAADRETDYVSGSYWVEELLVHVNNGLGFTLAPVRYNAPPTVSVITLSAD